MQIKNVKFIFIALISLILLEGCASLTDAETSDNEMRFHLDEAIRYINSAEYKEAEKSYSKAISAAKNLSINCSLAADCELYKNTYKKNMARLYSGRAYAKNKLHNNKDAIGDAELALEYDNKYHFAHFIMAKIYLDEQRHDDYAKELKALKRLADNRSLPEEDQKLAKSLYDDLLKEKEQSTHDLTIKRLIKNMPNL